MAPDPGQTTKLIGGPCSALVDTSLLIEQQKRPSQADLVRQALSRYRFRAISSYSKLEFKRAWAQRLAYIHKVSYHPHCNTVNDVYYEVNRLLANTFHHRRVQTCFDALIAFQDLDGGQISDRAQLARLRAHCKQAVLGAAAWLKQARHEEFKGTGCVRAEELPRELPDGSLDTAIRQCRPADIHCRIHEYFNHNKDAFDQIRSTIESSSDASDELKKMLPEIKAAEKDATHLCDNRHCAKIADAIIAVDGRKVDEYAANNDKEWRLLARSMVKALLNPVSGQRFDPGPA